VVVVVVVVGSSSARHCWYRSWMLAQPVSSTPIANTIGTRHPRPRCSPLPFRRPPRCLLGPLNDMSPPRLLRLCCSVSLLQFLILCDRRSMRTIHFYFSIRHHPSSRQPSLAFAAGSVLKHRLLYRVQMSPVIHTSAVPALRADCRHTRLDVVTRLASFPFRRFRFRISARHLRHPRLIIIPASRCLSHTYLRFLTMLVFFFFFDPTGLPPPVPIPPNANPANPCAITSPKSFLPGTRA